MEQKKYTLLRRPLLSTEREAYRIRALRDIPEHGVKKGDLGGHIRSETNLSQAGSSWVAPEATVLDNAKVRDNALVKDNVVMTDYSIAEENSVVGGFVRMKDSSVIRGNAEFVGMGSMSDTSLLEGDVVVRHSIDLFGDEHVSDQSQLPWYFKDAKHDEPGFLGRFKAAQGDPAFQLFFRSLGATHENERLNLIDTLWQDDPDGRKALEKIGHEIGGSFYVDEYVPLTLSEITNRRTLVEQAALNLSNAYGLRRLNGVHDEIVSLRLGQEIVDVAAGEVAAVLAADRDANGRELYQPALVVSYVESRRNAYPIPQSVQIIDETFTSYFDARQRAIDYLELARSPDPTLSGMPPPKGHFGQVADVKVQDLPFVTVTDAGTTATTLLMQKTARDDSGLLDGLKVEQPIGFSAIRLRPIREKDKTDLSRDNKFRDLEVYALPEEAVANARFVFESASDLRSTLSGELTKQTQRLAEIETLIARDDGRDSSVLGPLIREREALSPAGVPVLDRIGETGKSNMSVKDLLRPLNWQQDGAGGFTATSLGVEVSAKSQYGLWRVTGRQIDGNTVSFDDGVILDQKAAFEAGEHLRAELLQSEFVALSNIPAVYRVLEPGEDTQYIPAIIRLDAVGFSAELQDETFPNSWDALDAAVVFANSGDVGDADLDDRASFEPRPNALQRASSVSP